MATTTTTNKEEQHSQAKICELVAALEFMINEESSERRESDYFVSDPDIRKIGGRVSVSSWLEQSFSFSLLYLCMYL